MASAAILASMPATSVDPSILASYGQDAISVAQPGAVARPHSVEELQKILAFCNEHHIPLTPCGSQTSMTGASLNEGGLILSTELLSKDWSVYEDPEMPGRWLADAGPAIILADFQDALEAKGFFYPPDPTSRGDAMLGATISTNASGEDTYKYGATRRWVRGLSYVTADGALHHVKRDPASRGDGRKNTSGYPIRDNPVDLLIGSEGTLGIVVGATVEVLPVVPQYFAILYFLPGEEAALEHVAELQQSSQLSLRCLEYMDEGALRILAAKGVDLPEGAGAAVYVKQEFDADEDEQMEAWSERLERLFDQLACPHFMDHVHFAGDRASQKQLRAWRHYIPATINERAAGFREGGGGKISTDWYVPVPRLKEMFARVRADQHDMAWVVFGHIGNGHPHFNFITRNRDEYQRGRQLLFEHCRLAVALGGGVSGEHGLGKLKRHLLPLQYSEKEITAMRQIKAAWDPKGILAPGNIFP